MNTLLTDRDSQSSKAISFHFSHGVSHQLSTLRGVSSAITQLSPSVGPTILTTPIECKKHQQMHLIIAINRQWNPLDPQFWQQRLSARNTNRCISQLQSIAKEIHHPHHDKHHEARSFAQLFWILGNSQQPTSTQFHQSVPSTMQMWMCVLAIQFIFSVCPDLWTNMDCQSHHKQESHSCSSQRGTCVWVLVNNRPVDFIGMAQTLFGLLGFRCQPAKQKHFQPHLERHHVSVHFDSCSANTSKSPLDAFTSHNNPPSVG